MKVRVLGPLEVVRGGVLSTPSAPKLRRVLALLAVNANSVVRTDLITEELWGDRPPASAATTLQTYVYQLRKLLRLPGGSAGSGGLSGTRHDEDGPMLYTVAGGYVLGLPEMALDAAEFVSLAATGRADLGAGHVARAIETLQVALALWRGPVLADVGPVLYVEAVRLEEMRKSVVEARIDADLALGRHQEVVAELYRAVAQQPTHEGFQCRLMLALSRSGRRSEALHVYQRARAVLGEELGLEPSAELQRLHAAVLGADTSIEAPAGGGRATWEVRARRTPNMLPPDAGLLVGRDNELCMARDEITQRRGGGSAVVEVHGRPGVGSSAFCVRLAHAVREHFPDGQFCASLVDADSDALDPGEVLGYFLRSVGVPAKRLPASTGERSRMWFGWTSERKVLVVLDDAVAAKQLLPLLPAGSACATIVSSRRRLVTPAVGLSLNLLPLEHADATRLLSAVVGERRVADKPEAADELIRWCFGLPLALHAAAARLGLRPHWTISRLVGRIASADQPMAELRAEGLDPVASVRRTARLLPPAVREAFALLAGTSRSFLAVAEAAATLGVADDAAESVLEYLAEFQLAEVQEVGGGYHYRLSPYAAIAAMAGVAFDGEGGDDVLPQQARQGQGGDRLARAVRYRAACSRPPLASIFPDLG